MKVQGVIINDDTYGNPKAQAEIKSLFPGVIYNQGEIDNWEDWEDVRNTREEKLELLTKKTLIGSDDGRTFYFSDDEEAIAAIQTVYPELTIVELESSNIPWDYHYIRDNVSQP